MTTRDFQTRSPMRIFLSYFRPHRGLFLLDMTCAFFISLVDLAFPLISRTAMYHWLPDKRYSVFFTVMAIVLIAFVIRSILFFVVCYWGHTFGIRVEADIRRDLFAHMQELGFDFYDKNRTGQLMSRLTTDLFELTELAHHGPEDLFISIVTIAGALAVMFTIQWRMALVVSVILPVFVLTVMHRRRSMGRASRAAKQKTGAINAEIESGLSGVRTTKAFGNEHQQQRRFDGANEVFKTAKREFHKQMGLFNASMEFFLCILNVAVIAYGGLLIMQERMTYIDLITFSLYISTFISPIRKLANFAEMFSNGFAGLQRFIELMATEPTIQDAPDAAGLPHPCGEVGIHHVRFAYPDSPEVLHDIALTVAPGETVALVGPSGGGKSTLCSCRGFMTSRPAPSRSMGSTCAASASATCAAASASSSRTSFSSPIRSARTSATAAPMPRTPRSSRPRARPSCLRISRPCPTALTPTLASAERSSPADRSSASPSRASF